jgi:hypothetical protein
VARRQPGAGEAAALRFGHYAESMDRDTSPQRRDRYLELLRALTPAQRLARAADLSDSVRELAEAGIRQRHPGASDEEVRVRLVVRLYGREFAARHYAAVPADAR